MTRLKGFYKNRYERPEPVLYAVCFETGWEEYVMAKSNYDARNKAQHLCSSYGFITGAREASKEKQEQWATNA